MALHSLYCADVPLRNCSLIHLVCSAVFICVVIWVVFGCICTRLLSPAKCSSAVLLPPGALCWTLASFFYCNRFNAGAYLAVLFYQTVSNDLVVMIRLLFVLPCRKCFCFLRWSRTFRRRKMKPTWRNLMSSRPECAVDEWVAGSFDVGVSDTQSEEMNTACSPWRHLKPLVQRQHQCTYDLSWNVLHLR